MRQRLTRALYSAHTLHAPCMCKIMHLGELGHMLLMTFTYTYSVHVRPVMHVSKKCMHMHMHIVAMVNECGYDGQFFAKFDGFVVLTIYSGA